MTDVLVFTLLALFAIWGVLKFMTAFDRWEFNRWKARREQEALVRHIDQEIERI